MQSLMLALSVVVPLIVYMAIGVMVRASRMMSYESLKELNGMIFKILIPLALFFDVYESDLGNVVRLDLFAYIQGGVLLIFVLSWISVSYFVKDSRDASVMIQGMYRSNFVLFGGMIAGALCDKNGQSVVAALIAMVVPTFNILAVVLFEVKRGGKIAWKQVLINIAKNPLVDAGVLGVIANLSGIKIPTMIASPLDHLGNTATPIALVALGGMLSLKSIQNHMKKLTVVTLVRLCIVPLIMVSIGILLGYRGDIIVALLAVFAAPTAVASNPMAQSMGGNAVLAGEIVAVTTVTSILSIFLFVFTLSNMGML